MAILSQETELSQMILLSQALLRFIACLLRKISFISACFVLYGGNMQSLHQHLATSAKRNVHSEFSFWKLRVI